MGSPGDERSEGVFGGDFEALFDEGLRLRGEERMEWLTRLAAERPQAAVEVGRLLEGVAASEGFLETPALSQRQLIGSLPSGHQRPKVTGFEILEELGRGGMGVVFRARQLQPPREVALKVLDAPFASPERRRRFEVEAEALARLSSSNIAQVFASGVTEGAVTESGVEAGPGGIPWLAMELVREARDLVSFAEQEHLAPRARVELLVVLADAISHAHRHGVLHRDLKPGNVLVDGAGELKVIDFGIARVEREIDRDTLDSTREGELLGTLAYMAPEQVAGGSVDARADVHALGLLLYELLCSRPPRDLRGIALAAVVERLTHEAPAPAVEAARALGVDARWILARALARAPEERYSTVEALAEDLRALLAGRPVAAGPPSSLYRARRFIGRHRVAVGLGSLAVLALVATTSMSVVSMRRAQSSAQALASEQGQTQRALERAQLERSRALDSRDFLRELISSPSPFGAPGASEAEGDGVYVRVADLLDARAAAIDAAISEDAELAIEQRLTLMQAYRRLGLPRRALKQAEGLLRAPAESIRDRAAEVSLEVGKVYYELGRFDEAIVELRKHLALLKSAGEDDPEVLLDAEVDLALALSEGVGPQEGIRELTRALDEFTDRVEPESRARFGALQALGIALYESGELDLAWERFSMAYRDAHELHGPDHPETLAAEHGLGLVELGRGLSAEAAERLESVHLRAKVTYGPLHARTQKIANALAAAWMRSGAVADAAQLTGATRELVIERLGVDSFAYLNTTQGHAIALARAGRARESAAVFGDLSAAALKLYGSAHEDTASFALQHARMLDNSGQTQEALAVFEQAHAYFVGALGAASERTLVAGIELANAQINVERYDEAIQFIGELEEVVAEQVAEGASGELAWKLPNVLGGALLGLRDYERAAAVFERALGAIEDDLKAELLVLGNLAVAQRGNGDMEASLETHRRCLTESSELHGPEAPATLMCDAALAWAQHQSGRTLEACARYRALLPRASEAFSGHWTLAVWRGQLGTCLAALGEYGEAIEHLEHSRAELTRLLGADSARAQSALRVLEETRAASQATAKGIR